MFRVLITTVPFCQLNRAPIEMLNKSGIEFVINPIGRKLKEDELAKLAVNFDALIAGTEIIGKKVFESAPRLKLIARVGIGLDGVDLKEAKNRNIMVSYTPDAPAPAVAELTIGLMLSMLRSIHSANMNMHIGKWDRIFGRRISEVKIGIIGVGRIGKRVLDCLSGFAGDSKLVVYANDINRVNYIHDRIRLVWLSKEEIYSTCDVISLHLPLTELTCGLIKKDQLLQMRADAILINTSRGQIIDEMDLAEVLSSGHLAGAAIDVFEEEPYHGPLSSIDKCLMTAHMGSMSIDCRERMELEATSEVIRFFEGKDLISPVFSKTV